MVCSIKAWKHTQKCKFRKCIKTNLTWFEVDENMLRNALNLKSRWMNWAYLQIQNTHWDLSSWKTSPAVWKLLGSCRFELWLYSIDQVYPCCRKWAVHQHGPWFPLKAVETLSRFWIRSHLLSPSQYSSGQSHNYSRIHTFLGWATIRFIRGCSDLAIQDIPA